MSNVAKLKKKAAEFEQKKQFDKAVVLYRQILDDTDPSDPDADVALFNRVGDILLRQGNVSDAVHYYERAVDVYAEGGFFNNAIALCNKILRQSPGRSSIYYKLGKISAKKGFASDAKQNFLEYADRMQRAGQLDEAFRALKEFADLCPDQDDIRLMLADQLARRDRKDEALEQLQTLYERFEAEGRDSEARATVDRMKAIDPAAEPKAGVEGKKAAKSGDLVFLDVDYDTGPPTRRPAPRPTVKLPPSRDEGARSPSRSPISDLPLIDTGLEPYRPSGGAEPPLDPAAFAAMRLGTPADLRAVGRASEHDLALPGDLPDLEEGGGEELVPDADDLLDPGASLDGLVPPIARGTSSGPQLETGGLDIQRTNAADPLDAGSLAMSQGLDVESTMFDMDDTGASGIGPLAGFEQTAVGDEAGGDAFAMFGNDLTDDEGLLMIEDDAGDAAVDLPPVMPDDAPAGRDADDRATRVLTPAEIAAIDDLAARRASAPPPQSPPPAKARPEPEFLLSDPVSAAPADETTTRAGAGRDFLDADAAPASGSSLEDFSFLEPPPRPAAARAPETSISDDVLELVDELPIGARAPAQAGAAMRLAEKVSAAPEDWGLRRAWAEALLDAGERAEGLHQFDQAMIGAERAGDLPLAQAIADEVIRVDRDSVRHHQKRVEYAFRTADRPRLVDAYLELADSLFRMGQPDKARVVYQRVLELAPDDLRASAAIGAISGISPAAAPPRPSTRAPAPRPSNGTSTGAARRYTGEASRTVTPPEKIVPVAPAPRAPAPAPERPAPLFEGDESFVNLGDLLRADEGPKSTRMIVAEEEPTGDEQADFADMLRKFKQGVAANVEEEDYDSHYDLGVAYKEMGLLDEAISEFQKALRGPHRRVRTYEALGQCFLEKKQWQVAATILQRADAEPGQGDEQLVGVLYLLGYVMEAMQRPHEALSYYQRVFAVDIDFRDVAERLSAVEKAAT